MTKKFEISKSFILLFLPAAIWLISNNYINQHYHILSNGQIISHSHPYGSCSQNPIQGHHHTDFEYSILAQLASNSNTESAESYSVEFIFNLTENTHKDTYQLITTSESDKLPGLRAPPVS